jgi:hypothetical protein
MRRAGRLDEDLHGNPENPGPARAQHLGELPGSGSLGRPEGAQGHGLRRDPRVQRPPDGLAAVDDRASVQRRRAGRLLREAAARHLPGAHHGARGAGAAGPGRLAGRLRQGARVVGGGGLQGRRPLSRGGGRPRRLVAARDLVLAAVHDRPFDVAAVVAQLRDLLQKVRLGPSTGAIVAAARDRGIPVRRSTPRAWSSSATAPASAASWPRRPTAPAPSPSRSPRTRS